MRFEDDARRFVKEKDEFDWMKAARKKEEWIKDAPLFVAWACK